MFYFVVFKENFVEDRAQYTSSRVPGVGKIYLEGVVGWQNLCLVNQVAIIWIEVSDYWLRLLY